MMDNSVSGVIIPSTPEISTLEPQTVPLPAAGGSAPPQKILNPFTVISQQDTWAPDATYANDRQEECAQACAVMVTHRNTDVWTSAAYLHDMVHKSTENIPTTIDQLQYMLRVGCGSASVIETVDSVPSLRTLIVSAIDSGHCLIPLRYYSFPGNSILHFCVYYGYTPNLFQLAGPWSGTSFTEADDYSYQMLAGPLLRVLRKRMLGNH